MKKKMKLFAVLVAALTCTFVSCLNANETEDAEGEKQGTSTYTITFYANADDATGKTASVSAKAGSMVTLTPNGFSRAGYQFAAWATSAGGAKAYFNGANIMLARDLSLYAVWEKWDASQESFAVSFDSNGGSTVTMPVVIVNSGGTVAKPAEPTRAGYEFAGWYNGDTAFDFSSPVTKNLYLVAHWNAVTYTITYHLNGGDWASGSVNANEYADDEEATQAYTATTSYTVADSVFLPDADKVTRAGYGFAGWFEDEDFAGEAVRGLEGATGNKAYYAKWLSGAVIYTVRHLQQNANDDGYTLLREEHYAGMMGEQTKATAESYEGFTAQEVSQQTIPGSGRAVVEIKYDRELYEISYLNGVSDEDIAVPETQKVRYGQTVAVSFAVGSRSQFAFIGWSTDWYHESGDALYTKDGKNSLVLDRTENVVLTAQWKRVSVETKAKPDAVGDVVLKDGTAVAYDKIAYMSDEQKEDAIAVIFYKGTDCSNDGKSRMLGVGFDLTRTAHEWCLDVASGYTRNISTIQCVPDGSVGSYTFTGDKDGSDNRAQIADFLSSDSDIDAKKTAILTRITSTRLSYYPAFAFAKEYASAEGVPKSESGFSASISLEYFSHRVSGTDYEEGWYLPSVAELYALYNARETVDAAFVQCGDSTKFRTSQFWSSSQWPIYANCAYTVDFSDGSVTAQDKTTGYAVCPIREF